MDTTTDFDIPDQIIDGHTAAAEPFDTLGETGLCAVVADGIGTVWSVWANPAGGYYATDGNTDMTGEALSEILLSVAGIGT